MLIFTSNLSLAAFSQSAEVAMAATVVEGSEPCQWHAVSQVCHICGTCPELEGKTSPSSAALLRMVAVKTVKYDAACLPTANGDGRRPVTVFGQKRVKEAAWVRLGRKISDSELDWQDDIFLLSTVSSCQVLLIAVLTVLLLFPGFPLGNWITEFYL